MANSTRIKNIGRLDYPWWLGNYDSSRVWDDNHLYHIQMVLKLDHPIEIEDFILAENKTWKKNPTKDDLIDGIIELVQIRATTLDKASPRFYSDALMRMLPEGLISALCKFHLQWNEVMNCGLTSTSDGKGLAHIRIDIWQSEPLRSKIGYLENFALRLNRALVDKSSNSGKVLTNCRCGKQFQVDSRTSPTPFHNRDDGKFCDESNRMGTTEHDNCLVRS